VKDRDGIPVSTQIEMAVREWLKTKGIVRLKTGATSRVALSRSSTIQKTGDSNRTRVVIRPPREHVFVAPTEPGRTVSSFRRSL